MIDVYSLFSGCRTNFRNAPLVAFLIGAPLIGVLIDRIGGHDLVRIAQVCLSILCSVVLCLDRSQLALRASPQSAMLISAIAAAAILSTLNSPDREMAARELAVFLGMAATALLVARSGGSHAAKSRVAAIASSVYIFVVLLVIGLAYWHMQALNRAELFIGYDNYRFFNHTQTAALPLAVLALTVAERGHWLSIVAWFSAIAGFALLYALAGRGTLVGIIAGAAAVGLVFGRASFLLLRNLALGAALGMVLFAVVFLLVPIALGLPPSLSADFYGTRLGSVEMRLFLWRIAGTYIEQSPWLGIGPMHYAHFPTGDAAHPHNIYLQIGAEWGLPMLGLVVLSALVALQRLSVAVRNCRSVRDRNCGIGLFLACVAIAVDGLFSGNFVMPVSQVWIAFTFGWAAAWWRAHANDESQAISSNLFSVLASRTLALAFLSSQIWLLWSIWPELHQLNSHIQSVMEQVPAPTMNPRFWSHGWF